MRHCQQFFLLWGFTFVFVSSLYGAEAIKSTRNEQVSVEVTVYNNNLALIKDTRKVMLSEGEGELRFMDVAAFIRPVTVHVQSLNAPADLKILEQNYEYDLINTSKLMDKYVGKKVKLMLWNEFQDRKEVVEALLVSHNDNDPVFQIENEIYLGHPGIRILPELPENLIAQPTLMWQYNNASEEAHQLEVSYLTDELTWNADYIFVVNEEDTGGDISGWVTIDNQSGATYREAKLKLVAGEVQRVEEAYPERYKLGVMAEMARAPAFEEQAFFEYHIYNLDRRTTIKDRQIKQIRLLEAAGITAQKELWVHGETYYFTTHYRPQKPKEPVHVYMKFKNAQDNRLGIPLPAGVMRLYKKDKEGSLQFIGEDRIKHTPKDEEVKLKVGEAFDVVAERTQTDYKQLSTQLYESAWEITVRNHKEQEVQVGVIEPLSGNWQVISESHPHKKLDAFTIRYDVTVPPDAEVKVQYRIRVGL